MRGTGLVAALAVPGATLLALGAEAADGTFFDHGGNVVNANWKSVAARTAGVFTSPDPEAPGFEVVGPR